MFHEFDPADPTPMERLEQDLIQLRRERDALFAERMQGVDNKHECPYCGHKSFEHEADTSMGWPACPACGGI